MPKSVISSRANRPVLRFLNGIVIGRTKFTAAELASIETVANLSAQDLAALANTAETLVVVGDAESGLVKDVADLKTTVDTETTGLTDRVGSLETTLGDAESGLVKDVADLGDRVTALEATASLDFSEDANPLTTYVYSATPEAPVTEAITAGSTAASIAPQGSTEHALTFSLPASPPEGGSRVFKLTYDKGTHAGTLTVGGVALTGAGVLHFFWSGTAWETWTAGAYTVAVPDNCPGIIVALADAGDANTLTVVLPTGASNLGNPIGIGVILTATTGTACKVNLTANLLTASGVTEDVADVANGAYVAQCVGSNLWIPTCAGGIPANT